MGEVRVGPAGWNYRDWKGVFYPTKKPRGFSELEYVAEYFDTAEINSSFYGPFSPESAAKWIKEVSANGKFVFTGKLWQQFTHTKGANDADEKLVRAGFDVLQNAGKLGAVLVQFPFSFHNTKDNLETLNGILERFRSYPLVVEVRHASWDKPEILEFLKERSVGFCNIDQPLIGRSLGPTAYVTSKVGYVRFHGRNQKDWFEENEENRSARYDYKYSAEEIAPWVERIHEIEKESEGLFVVTNNHPQAKSIGLATAILAMILK